VGWARELPTLTYDFPAFAPGPETAFGPAVTAEESTGFWWLLPWLYLAGGLLIWARTLVQWKDAWRGLRGDKTEVFDGWPVMRRAGLSGPFAAFGTIFLPTEMNDAGLTRTALIHEAAHLRARHHYDTILLTPLSILKPWYEVSIRKSAIPLPP